MQTKNILYDALTDRQQAEIINCILLQLNERPDVSVDRIILFFSWGGKLQTV